MAIAVRYFVAILVGMIVAAVLISVIELAGYALHPPPAGMDMTDREAVAAHVSAAPPAAQIVVVVAWAVGAFVGGLVACLIARARQRLFAGIVAGMVLLGAIVNFALITQPWWMLLAAFVVLPVAAALAARIAPRPKGSPA